MTRWHVETKSQGTDRRVLEDVLARFDVKIEQTDDGAFLISDGFDALDQSGQVHEIASKIAAAIELAGRANPDLKFDLGTVIVERRPDGSEARHQSVKVLGVASIGMVGLAIAVQVGPSAALSEAERAQAVQRQREEEHRQRVESLSDRALAAFKNETAAKIQRWLAAPAELDTTTMTAIAELIERETGSNRKDLGREIQFGRFFGSINHQKIFGDQARHATLITAPHPNPMSKAEADIFIRDVAERWFRYVAERA